MIKITLFDTSLICIQLLSLSLRVKCTKSIKYIGTIARNARMLHYVVNIKVLNYMEKEIKNVAVWFN